MVSRAAAALQAGPLLRVQDVSVRFRLVRALEGVDLEVQAGETVALAGENGAGKSTLVRCIAGDITPSSGRVLLDGRRIEADRITTARRGVAVVWQDLALCENLDVAANLMLGRERRGLLRADTGVHVRAGALLRELGIPLGDTTQRVSTLSGGQRQLLAVARAMSQRPRLLVLDEPTASLGLQEATQVEALTARVRDHGTTVLLVTHDVDQMFRLADRIVVLRQGRLVGDVDAVSAHPDDIVALILGQQIDVSPRRQLSRLHGLVDRLASADSSSSLPLILSALGAALDTPQLCLHLVEGTHLRLATQQGLRDELAQALTQLPFGLAGGPVGLAAESGETVVDSDVRTSVAWAPHRQLAARAHIGSTWAVPVTGAGGLTGVITVFRRLPGIPPRDQLNLVALYAGYAANVVERERLLGEVTARNRVLETIREVLETLAGPVPFSEGLTVVLAALSEGLQADVVALVAEDATAGAPRALAVVDSTGAAVPPPSGLERAAREALNGGRRDGRARVIGDRRGGVYLAVTFAAPGGASSLLAHWAAPTARTDGTALMEDAANSLRLAHERQEADRARREATALRRSQELQRTFLSRLSHELRTPLTAIRGFASSLMAPDVTWDGDSERRFLSRIGAESARLNRLVDDLLDFSAIEASILRLQPDWCDLALVLDAAIGCLAPHDAEMVTLGCDANLPVVWADHDRLEQVFVNLLDNALRHNPAGTHVVVAARQEGDAVTVTVTDDGTGIPADIAEVLFAQPRRRRVATSGAGLGLSIAKGIVDAHGTTIDVARLHRGTRFSIRLPIEQPQGAPGAPANGGGTTVPRAVIDGPAPANGGGTTGAPRTAIDGPAPANGGGTTRGPRTAIDGPAAAPTTPGAAGVAGRAARAGGQPR